MESGLANKIVLVTGGGRGIGFETAVKFAQEKAEIILADLDLEATKASASKITSEYGVPCHAYQADLSSVSNIEKLFAEINEKHGRLDVLVNNAGMQIRNLCIDYKEADWDKLMSINLKAVFFCCQQAARIMKNNGGGAIVNVSSGTSKRTGPNRSPYIISKAGVNALTEAVACEFAELGIRVNAVGPGWIMTQILQDAFTAGIVTDDQLMAAIPFKRYAEISEISDAIVYLASKNASYITGQTLFVDGGQTAQGLPDINSFL